MKPYLNKIEAVIKLHEKGFTDDFKLIGDNLLWVQGKMFLRPGQFVINEVHRFLSLAGNETIVFGVEAIATGIKGILLNHYKNYTDKMPAVINYELLKMGAKHINRQYDYVDVTFVR